MSNDDEQHGAIWVNPRTGETVEPGTKGAIEVEPPPPEILQEREQEDREWLPDWYGKRLVEHNARIARLTDQYERRVAQEVANRAALRRHWQDRLEAVARFDMALAQGNRKKGKKSVDYAYGRVGLRTSTKTIVTDEEAAIDHALGKGGCPDAVKETVTVKLLTSALPKGKEWPGIKVETSERFYDE